jgi:cell division protein FtsB
MTTKPDHEMTDEELALAARASVSFDLASWMVMVRRVKASVKRLEPNECIAVLEASNVELEANNALLQDAWNGVNDRANEYAQEARVVKTRLRMTFNRAHGEVERTPDYPGNDAVEWDVAKIVGDLRKENAELKARVAELEKEQG